MKVAVLLVLGLAELSVSGAPPGEVATTPGAAAATTPLPGGPWVLVQTDGSRVTFEAPPQNRSGRLVGRLHGSGTLVSIPTARVDTKATERANTSGAAAVPPPPRVRPTLRPFEVPPLGDRVRMKTSPEDARKMLEGVRTGEPAPTPPPGTTPTVAPVAEEKAPTDNHGRSATYWRERAEATRGVFDEAERNLAAAETQLKAAERSFLGVGEAERNTYIVRVIEARDLAEKARAEHSSAKGRWEALQEEARKAGAFPGWLR
ncbi:MAG: hypothetical protein HY900_13675 [Deltaproteobacteria bacterium]|nr:hypothetical protein [Deltaproteobacteria bacterium]